MKDLVTITRPGKWIASLVLITSLLAALLVSTPVVAAPSLTLSTSVGAAGTITTIAGNVFDSYIGDTLYVFFNAEEIDYSPFTVPQSGSFEIPFSIPVGTEAGIYRILVSSDSGGVVVIADAWFTVEETAIFLDIVTGPVGTAVTITGTGFYAGSTVTLYYHDQYAVQMGSSTASDTGAFHYNYAIPSSTAGTHTIAASNIHGDNADAAFTITPSLSLSQYSGGPGEIIDVTGTGFAAQSEFYIFFGPREVIFGVTDELGNFGGFNFFVPNLKANPYDVIAQDNMDNADSVRFTVTAGAALSATSGAVGSSLTVRGDGFAPGGSITVYFDELVVDTLTANNDGGFRSTFQVPAAGAGSHDVIITDGTTSKEFSFAIESDAPPAPVQLLPVNGSQTGSAVLFDWEDVNDESLPVTYHLQVADDNAFSSLLLDNTSLDTSGYSANDTSIFSTSDSSVTYYWRVRARDAALNESDWSAQWSFVINPPEAPVLFSAGKNEDEDALALDWGDVISPNAPITYTLEIADEATFTTTVISKSGIVTSGYTVTGADYSALKKNTTYYWRVKATDAAKIESEWSDTGTLVAGSSSPSGFPIWGIIAIAAIGILIIAYLAFRMGRKTAYEQE